MTVLPTQCQVRLHTARNAGAARRPQALCVGRQPPSLRGCPRFQEFLLYQTVVGKAGLFILGVLYPMVSTKGLDLRVPQLRKVKMGRTLE
jgi:hypothetical protein